MLRVTLTFLALFAGTVCSSVGRAQETPLEFFNGNVDIIVRLSEPDKTVEKLVKVVNKIQPGVGDLVQAQKSVVLGQLISNPTLTGVDESRDWYIGVYGEKNAPPTIVFAIPAVNATDFAAALNDRFKSSVQKGWVVYTDADALPERAAETAAAKLPANVKTRLAAGDLTVYFNTEHLSEVYSEQLELLKDKIQETLSTLPGSVPTGSDVSLTTAVKLYSELTDSFFQSIKDSTAASLNLTFSESEIGLDKFVDFKAGSASAKFLADNKQSRFDRLSQLPANWPLYAGFSANSKEIMKWGAGYTASMFSLEGDRKAAVEALFKDAEQIDMGSQITAMDVADATVGVLRGVTFQEASPIAKARELGRKTLTTLGTLSTPAFEQETTLQIDAETFGSHKADLIYIKQTQSEEADPLGVGRKMMEIMADEKGLENRTVYLSDFSVSTLGGGRKLMEDTLKSLESKKSNRIEKFRTSLMKDSNITVLVDIPGLVGRIVKVASKVEGSPLMVNSAAIDSLGLAPSYLGIAVGSDGDTLKSQLRIPMEQITGMTKLGVLIGASMRPGL